VSYLSRDELKQYARLINNQDIEGYERHIVKLLNMGGTYGTTADAKKQAEASFKELLGKLLIEDRDDEHEIRWQDFFMLHQQEQQQGKDASLEPFVHKQYPYQKSAEPAPAKPERVKPNTTGSFANLQRQIFTALKAQNQSAACGLLWNWEAIIAIKQVLIGFGKIIKRIRIKSLASYPIYIPEHYSLKDKTILKPRLIGI